MDFEVAKGILITEESVEGGTFLCDLKVEVSRQNALLSEVQIKMAELAELQGGNFIGNFSYTQKAHSRFQLTLPKWDTESLIATGKLYLFEHDPRTK
jgi:hypothetical protein